MEANALHLGFFIGQGRVATEYSVAPVLNGVDRGLDVLFPRLTQFGRHTAATTTFGFNATQRTHAGGQLRHRSDVPAGIFRPKIGRHALGGNDEVIRRLFVGSGSILEDQTSRYAIAVRYDGLNFGAAIVIVAIGIAIGIVGSIPYLDVAQLLFGLCRISQCHQQIRFP